MDILELFPTAVGVFEFGRDFTKRELQFMKKQPVNLNVGNTVSVNKNLLDSKELGRLHKFIHKSLNVYLEKIINPKQNTSLRITQSWCNYSEKDQWHHKHTHPNSFLSGVLYIQGDKNVDKIFFHRKDLPSMRTPAKEWNPFNSETWWLEVYAGRLLIFPSSLEHSVEKVTSNETRISLSFNTFPTGHFGDDEALTGLNL